MNTLDLLFDWLLQASLRASLLTLVVLPLQWTLRKHLSARLLHALWLPVLIVALLPVWPQSRWSAESLVMEARPTVTSVPQDTSTPAPAPVMAGAPVMTESSATIPWKQVGAFIWAAGVAGVMAVGFMSLGATLRRFRRTAGTPEVETVNMVAQLVGQLELKRTPKICQSSAISSPAVAGLFHPVLLLPETFLQSFTSHEARLVLKHELMHLKRGDLLMNALLCLLMALHWFNPLLWLAFHKARLDREAACDEDVLRHVQPDERATYGHALLKAESAFCPRGWSLGFVGIFDRGAGLRTRILAIASPRTAKPRMTLFAFVLMALMTYLGSTQAQVGGLEKKPTDLVIDTKLGPDLSQGSEGVRSRSDVNGPAVVIDVKVIDVSAIGTVKLLSTSTTLKDSLTVMGIANGQADLQVKMLTESGATVLSAPRMYTVSGNEGRIEVKKGGQPFVKEASFVGTRCTLLPTLQDDSVNLDVNIEHASMPGQTARYQTTETMKNGATILLTNLQAEKGKPRVPIILITLAWNAEEGPVANKLRNIILPRVQFSEATLSEALEFLRIKSRDFDTHESEPGKRGVNIVLKAPQSAQARISLDLKDVPLQEALKYTAELANLGYWIEGSAVVFVAESKTTDIHRESTEPLGKAVEGIKGVILPNVQFSGASLDEAVEFLRIKLRQGTREMELPPINLILKPGGDKATITLDLKEVPLWEALKYTAELANHTLSADDHSIILTPK